MEKDFIKSVEAMYDEIRDTDNRITNVCGFAYMNTDLDDKSVSLMEKIMELSSQMSDVAHELEEHLAWD